MNHQLDIIHDTSPEGMFTLAKQSKTSRGWFKGFPYAHPDPTLPAVIFNDQNELFKNRDVRWALALLIDIKAVSMASYRGAATISAIGVPPTGTHPENYHEPMEAWLKDFELDTGKRKIKPYDPDHRQADRRHAAAVAWATRSRTIPKRSPRPSAWAGGSPIRRPRPSCCEKAGFTQARRPVVHAGRQALHDQDHGRRRGAAGDDARRLDDRAAVAPVRHRRQDRSSRRAR